MILTDDQTKALIELFKSISVSEVAVKPPTVHVGDYSIRWIFSVMERVGDETNFNRLSRLLC